MNKDTQIIHYLWWLRKFLNDHFGDMEYKDVIRKELGVDVCNEVDELVKYIKENY